MNKKVYGNVLIWFLGTRIVNLDQCAKCKKPKEARGEERFFWWCCKSLDPRFPGKLASEVRLVISLHYIISDTTSFALWIMTRDDNALYLPLSFFWRNSNNPVSPGGKPSNVYLTRKMISCNQSSRILSHHLGHFYLRKYPRYHTGWKIELLMKSWKIIKLNFLFPKIKKMIAQKIESYCSV